jgi:hypothetical protein
VWKEIEKYGRDVCKYKIKPYVGIGCEYERVEEGAKYGQIDIESSKVRRVSVTGDVGAEGQIWKIGVRCGCECYVGNRQGVEGLVKIKYAL